MDELVLKWITFLCGVLTLVVCVSLYFFPDLHAREVLAAEQQERVGSADVVADYVDPDEVVVSDETVDAQLAIALPQDLPEDELEVENDYITQTIYIRFAGGVDDYFEQYSIKGSCDHIASLSYYKDGNEGVIALMLDKVYELSQEYRSGSLYLDFVDPHDIYDKIVVVDAGHGGKMPGALKLGIAEKDIDLAILLKLKALFDADDENIGVYYTRTTDANPTLDQRVQLANKCDADLFISIHNNSSATGNFTSTKGTQVMYSESADAKLSSKHLAQICLDQVCKSLGSTKRNLLPGDSIYIIRTSKVPVALVEVGFMTNYEELDQLNDAAYQKKAAKGIYQAIKQAFEEGY